LIRGSDLRRQGAEGRGQEAGGRRQKAGGRRQEGVSMNQSSPPCMKIHFSASPRPRVSASILILEGFLTFVN